MAALTLATVGAKITAAFTNLIVARVNRQGLTSIIPTSVTGGTLGANGVVNATSGTLSINGCFTSEFDRYLITGAGIFKTNAVDIQGQLLVAGVATATNYYLQRVSASGVTVTGFSASATTSWAMDIGGLASSLVDARWELEQPFATTQTRGLYQASTGNSGVPVTVTGSMLQSASTSFDGIRFLVSAGTFTGTFRIFGYNNN